MVVTETDRLLVRRVLPGDVIPWQEIFGDPQVMRFGGLRSPEWVHDTITEMIERYYAEWGYGRWSIVEKATGDVIGTSGISRYPDRCLAPGEAELGYRFASASWGRGYATEAAAAICAAGFDVFQVPRIVAYIDPANTASVRIAGKIGMRHDGWVELQDHGPERRYVLDRP